MSSDSSAPRKTHPVSLAKLIDRACDEFEQSRTAGQPADLQKRVEQFPFADQRRLLEELLSLEIQLLRDEQCTIDMADYLARYSNAEPIVRRVFRRELLSSATVSLGFEQALSNRQSSILREPLLQLRHAASERSYATGEALIVQGTVADSLLLILKGRVEIRMFDAQGKLHVLDTSYPGQILGEMALLTDEPRTASAIAIDPVTAAILPADEFHKLARRCPQLGSLLTDVMATRLGRRRRDALTDKPLERYRIRQRLGRGGMSVVYEAVDIEKDQLVALKMMNHKLVYSATALERFHREGKLIERFTHPHIVRTLRSFPAFRTYFIALEYCAGETLSAYLQRHGPVDVPEFRRSLGQLAQAMTYAHEQGILHRDVKPSNIMRLPDGNLKLMDFGLAEPLADSMAGHFEISGTPRYMAPEQRVGKPLDHRVDYFALGCVAYELLSGVPLFRRAAKNELKRDFELWQAPDFMQLSPALDGHIASSLASLLATDRQQRPQNLDFIASWAAS